jgi:DNA polymerase-3 subunit alpha
MFINLHGHTQFSVLDSTARIYDYINRAKELGQSAVAITDHCTCAGAHDALKTSKELGVKLIIGSELYFRHNAKNKDEKFKHIILIAKNAIGYRNLLTLLAVGYDNMDPNAKKAKTIIDWTLLEKHHEGLICLTACGNGIIAAPIMEKNFDEAEQSLLKLKALFGDDLGLEVQPHGLKRFSSFYSGKIDQIYINNQLIKMGKKHDVRIVPTCNSHYVLQSQHKVHDAWLAISAKTSIYSNFRLKYDVNDFYLKDESEVHAFFARNHGDEFAQSIIDNTVYFADKCETPEWISPKFSNPSGKELPEFPVKCQEDYSEFKFWLSKQDQFTKDLKEDCQYLRFKVFTRLDMFRAIFTPDKFSEYKDRLDEELDVLESKDFSSYMLITYDFLEWARKNDIIVGPGRGSCGGSLVAHYLDIHQIDSIEYGLIFARFLNKEKTAYPDIDNDIAPSGRDRVIKYLIEKYGEAHVAHVSNYNTVTPKVYARDLCRALELGGSESSAKDLGDQIADSLPKEVEGEKTLTIKQALKLCPLFVEFTKRYPQLLEYQELVNLIRALATHAGGIIVAKRPLVGLVPYRRDVDGTAAIEYEKERAEENGLVKIDILGLSTLDIIAKTYDLIKSLGKDKKTFDFRSFHKEAYDLIGSGDTFCVFQLGKSSGTIVLCEQVKPVLLDDISNVNALARPSAREMRKDFIDVRNKVKEVELLHPKLQRAFGSTNGCGLYEECLLYLALDVAGWNLHKADGLRKLTKDKGKNPAKVVKLREDFIEGAEKTGVGKELGAKIWDEVVSGFAGYGFNKSHSTLYSITSYHTAWLKANYPQEFLLANLLKVMDSSSDTDKENLPKIKIELRAKGVKILPPDLNKSNYDYEVVGSNKLLTGFGALKKIGSQSIPEIIEKRPFKNFNDFLIRTDSKKVNAGSIGSLAAVGCLDQFGITRKNIICYASDYRTKLKAAVEKDPNCIDTYEYPFPNPEDEYTLSELFALEVEYGKEAFICEPPKAYKSFFADKSKYTIFQSVLKEDDNQWIDSMKAIIKHVHPCKVKKLQSADFGKEMMKLTMEDALGQEFTGTIFHKSLITIKERIKELGRGEIAPGYAIHFRGKTNVYDDEMGVVVHELFNIVDPPALPGKDDRKSKKVLKRDIKTNAESKKNKPLFASIEEELIDEELVDYSE